MEIDLEMNKLDEEKLLPQKTIDKRISGTLAIITGWFVVELVLWLSLGVFKSNYYSFGPSDKMILPFTHIVIDTWPKWTALIIHTMVAVSIEIYTADMFFPWATSVALNPNVPMEYNRFDVYRLINFTTMVRDSGKLLFFMMTYTQADVAMVSILSGIVAGAISTHRLVYSPNRVNIHITNAN